MDEFPKGVEAPFESAYILATILVSTLKSKTGAPSAESLNLSSYEAKLCIWWP